MGKDSTLFEDDFDFDLDSLDEFEPRSSAPKAKGPAAFDDEVEFDMSKPLHKVEEPLGVDLDPPPKPLEAMDETGDAAQAMLADEAPSVGDRPIPAIAIQAFIEKSSTREMVETIARDRRLSRASIEIHEGGLDAAIEHLAQSATPNLLLVESSAPGARMVVDIDRLAEHCDAGVEVMVIGATNDIPLYRKLVARGVSEYLVPPIQPLQVIRSISDLFTDPDA
ncbi:MAG: pilus assembly protein CpaE, partial [Hyphomonadaceae bacterium]|nr:pilus assembly protein CpaE [Hyphomonadaceae bacterium]